MSAKNLAISLNRRGHDAIGPGGLRVLAAILTYSKRHGYPPTLRDVGRQLGIHFYGVWQHVRRLQRSGLLRQAEQQATRTSRTLIAACWLELEGNGNG